MGFAFRIELGDTAGKCSPFAGTWYPSACQPKGYAGAVWRLCWGWLQSLCSPVYIHLSFRAVSGTLTQNCPHTGACRLSRSTPASNLLLCWSCVADPFCYPGWSPSIFSFPFQSKFLLVFKALKSHITPGRSNAQPSLLSSAVAPLAMLPLFTPDHPS